MAFSGDQLYRFYRFGQTRTRLTSIDPIIAFFCEWREYADCLYSATNIWRAQSQCAGGAGCGQPPAHKARRKIFFAGSQLSSNQTISGYVSCGPCGLDGGTRKNPHVVCSSAKTCRTNHKDQPHRRPAAAALPNLAPNPGIKIIARALYFKKKKIIAGASYSPELSAMQVNYFAQNFFSEKEHQGQGERRQCWRTWCSPGCVPPRGRPRRAFEAFEKHLAKEERGRTARGRQFGPTRLRGFRRWRRRGFPWVEET